MAERYLVLKLHLGNKKFEDVELREIIGGERPMVKIKRSGTTKLAIVPHTHLYIEYEGSLQHFNPGKRYEFPKAETSGGGHGTGADDAAGSSDKDKHKATGAD